MQTNKRVSQLQHNGRLSRGTHAYPGANGERPPLDAQHDWASAPTCTRLEPQMDRKDLYRLTPAFVDHFIASYTEPPAAIVLDIAHADDPTHGQ